MFKIALPSCMIRPIIIKLSLVHLTSPRRDAGEVHASTSTSKLILDRTNWYKRPDVLWNLECRPTKQEEVEKGFR